MKLYPDADERYPDWSLSPEKAGTGYDPIYLTAAEYTDYQRVLAEYAAWQKKIANKVYNRT